MEKGENISVDDVMSKLKDDGDFDRLRLKIIRQLKQNEELRNSIISTVKQSATLTRPGAQNMKPRQLSDAIHAEVGDKLMSQISDSLSGIIGSPDGMKNEIMKTVESVYNKLSNPSNDKNEASPSINNQNKNMKNPTETPNEVEYLSDDEPPGFSSSSINVNYQMKQPKEEQDMDMTYSKGQSEEPRQSKNEEMQLIDVVGDGDDDDDPVAPPGFG